MDPVERKQLHTLLEKGIQDLRLPLPTAAPGHLLDYLALLSKWNRVYNLTAITEPTAMLTRHILDSLSIAPYLQGSTVIDVGSGAGLPGIPLALCFPEKEFVLLDSNNKKTRFLTQAVTELHLNNTTVVHSRVELLTHSKGFDCILTRAFAPLNAMIASTQHLCGQGGQIFAMRGASPSTEELGQIRDWSYKVLPLQIPKLHEQRHLILLERNQRG
jgi:16S rRNA (guanine527-N7)-methyltransferase